MAEAYNAPGSTYWRKISAARNLPETHLFWQADEVLPLPCRPRMFNFTPV